MKKKLAALTLCAAMAVTALAGCGSSSGTSKSSGSAKKASGSGETVALKLWASEEDQDLMKDLTDKFKEANPDTKFDITIGKVSEADTKDTVLKDPTAAADVFSFASDQIYDLVDAGVLQPVQDEDKATIEKEEVESSVTAATVDDTLYAYPATADNGYFLYYDKNVISDDDAKTWDTILADSQKAGKKAGMVLNSGYYVAGFFYGADFTTVRNDDGSTTLDWNGTSSSGVKGVDVAQGMVDIAKNQAFMSIKDGDTANQIASGKLAAIISGTWDSQAVQKAFGDGYAATTLPTYTAGGKQVDMASASGFKFWGVNKNSKNVGWAMKLAMFLSNKDSQMERFTQRAAGPANKEDMASDAVKKDIAISAILEQNSKKGVVQTVTQTFWDNTKTFGETIAQGNPKNEDLQTLLDNLVKACAQKSE